MQNSKWNYLVNTSAALCGMYAVLFFGAVWFQQVAALIDYMYAQELYETYYTAILTTWSDGSFDTTMGFRYFGYRVLIPAILFLIAAIGLYWRRAWGYWLAMALGWIGLLEPLVRLVVTKLFITWSDSIGYQIDMQVLASAFFAASLPMLGMIVALCLPPVRRIFGSQLRPWRQFTIAHAAIVTTVCAVLLKHAISISQVYGIF